MKPTVGEHLPKGRMSEYEKKKRRHTLRRLLRYFKYSPWLTVGALLLAVVSNITVTLKPFILERVIDQNLMTGLNDYNALIKWAGLYFAVIVLGFGISYVQSIALASLGQRIMHKMRVSLFDKIQNMSMRFFDKNASGSILTRVSSDVESLSDLFSNVIISLVSDFLLVVNVLVMMFLMDVKLAFSSLVILPLVLAIALLYRFIARRIFIRIKAQLSRMNGFLAENIIGMRIVQMFGSQSKKYEQYDGLAKGYYKLSMMDMLLRSLSNPLLGLIGNISIGILIILYAKDVFAGVLLVGVLHAFTSYIKQFINPISRIAEQFTNIQSSLISAERIFDIMDNRDDVEDIESGDKVTEVRGEIEFKHVWFAYDEENWVLKDVSFKVFPGQTLAIVGDTGSGKTTVISLLARFYKIQKGEILIDGKNIETINLSSLRRLVAVVMQDVFLFSGDIGYNIRLNEESISDEDVDRAVRTVHANDFIQSLPCGIQSSVSERGCTFSAGQRQLIAFARAVAFEPRILVLDEATANIDSATEAALQDALTEASSKRTSIVIAHRISTIMSSDMILVMRYGEIIQRGTHTQLIAEGGHYADLCRAGQNSTYRPESTEG
ncbi:MAG TPA: ABC transporter ATP-binding protein [Oscillospiraceae bacterium]|nr:ABC transporter ATP-binding protein [Oscillospiraceae bacterium]HPF55525.1 ABC transporter ATP-binding protein [Clostridiales bacterium]HPK35701.1 ABC transporter ATP-binding protein [Oscillospiraceae bacterium]HPR76388.1 ABC transporter ATP-binding protein [Oscillospiraceae bacterium]